MFRFWLTIFGFFWTVLVSAQSTDTTIYVVTEQMPRFRFGGCEQLDTTLQVKQQCSQQALLAFVYANLQYPLQARLDNIEGTVVTSFVVEPDSSISNISLLKDIGGGCGNAVLSLLDAFNPNNIKWIPGKKDGLDVRVKITLPIKFKLTEAPPYVVLEGDTVYTRMDQEAVFSGNNASVTEYIEEKLPYPAAYLDSCVIGYMDVQLLIQPDGVVKTLNVLDYCYLGLDFSVGNFRFDYFYVQYVATRYLSRQKSTHFCGVAHSLYSF
ncbi:MAG: energy transducer TonB [Saprospiraceae bacterium]|nr:energy transducer TonB [Saprospiraceae bacterium]